MSTPAAASPTHLLLTEAPRTGASHPGLLEVLEHQAQLLLNASRQGHGDVAVLLRSHGLTAASAEPQSLSLEAARTLVAREHGYADYAQATTHGASTVDVRFEAAADAIVAGDLAALQALLKAHPELARARSSYPHRATLLHVSTQNGIEHTRQWQSPPNAPDLARALLEAGADPDATCNIGGGGNGKTPLYLLVSSSLPANAGVQAALVAVFCQGGANPNGLDDDGLPLWTAIAFGYPRAVEALAAAGARVDNVVLAAALGDIELVRRYAGANRGMPSDAKSIRMGANGPALAPEHMLEYALIYACGHGRLDVARFLLSLGLDSSVKEPMWKSSAVGMARFSRELKARPEDQRALVALLESSGPSATAR